VSVFPDTTLSRGDAPDNLSTNKAMARRLETAAPSRVRRATLKAGFWWGARRAPFEPVWNRSLFAAVKARVSIPVFAVGGIRTADEVNAILDGGQADMVGIGRPFYAEDDLAARILANDPGPTLCRNSNRCVPAQMLGMPGVCYNPEVNKARAATRA
jgi:2,4-dienoyl-CoA reductase-like NADH-dependent reductase (Old Yellow Enzyme family)